MIVPALRLKVTLAVPHKFSMLTTIAALSDRLHVGTIVSNVGFLHPALVIRQFAQMATLFGGDRVIITSARYLEEAVAGRAGTRITVSAPVETGT